MTPHPDLLAVEEAIHASEGEAQTIRAALDVVAPIVEERDRLWVALDRIRRGHADPQAVAAAALDPEPPRG